MKKLAFIFSVTLLSIFCTGCATTNRDVEQENNSGSQQQLMQHSAAMLKAFQAGDYSQLRGLLSENIAAEFPKEKFDASVKQLKKTLGKIKSYTFLTELEVPILRTLVYKVTFERTGNQQQKITQEGLFRVTMVEDKGKVMVLAFNFF